MDSQPRPRSRRRYVSRACLNCRQRKIKCSEDRPCQRCRIDNATCDFGASRRAPRLPLGRPSATIFEAFLQDDVTPAAPTSHDDQTLELNAREFQGADKLILTLGNRVKALEHDYQLLRAQIPTKRPVPESISVEDDALSNHSKSDIDDALVESVQEPSQTSLCRMIDVLDEVVGVPPQPETSVHGTSIPETQLSPAGLDGLSSDLRLCNVPGLRQALSTYFCYLNPNLPFLNENEILAEFENHLVNVGDGLDSQLFVALIYLILAETKILGEYTDTSSPILGWLEFCFADRILSRLSWLHRGSIRLIQCLLLKARYLSTVQRCRSAYHTMCKVVQVCFHLGLNNQTRWSGLTPFEATMRPRVFYAIFYLDRGISLNAGLPYLIRDTDFYVELPRIIDDRSLFAHRDLPEETAPVNSCIPYLLHLVNWAKLCSNLWDRTMSATAPKPCPEEVIMELDAEILCSLCQLTPHLKWDPAAIKVGHTSTNSIQTRRQMFLSHLHTNHLRLVMRHKHVISLQCSRRMAEDSVSIASSSIQAIDGYSSLSSPGQIHRLSSVMYLTAAIIPLICVLVQDCNSQNPRNELLNSFEKALELLQEMAPGFALARLMLRRLEAAIDVAKQAIERWRKRIMNIPNDGDDNMDMNQHLMHILGDLDHSNTEFHRDHGILFQGTNATFASADVSSGESHGWFTGDASNHLAWSASFPFA